MNLLTKEIIKESIKQIELKANGYDEDAHMEHDDLMIAFIEEIAEGHHSLEEIRDMAKMIKTIENIEFHRWYA
jgi:hypothetical protein